MRVKNMKKGSLLLFFSLFIIGIKAQTNTYSISFENAVHHEAEISMEFPAIKEATLSIRMANSSPGRYAFHSFAKNVYNFKATDSKGNNLKIHRPNPYQWDLSEHDGTVKISYTLFANRGDGTYAQVDETHAHLNIPATFMYAKSLKEREIAITFNTRKDLNWKVATQLKHKEGSTYWAPNLYYFMDSPVEISDLDIREFKITENGKEATIKFALHHNGTSSELDSYFESVKKIVLEQKDVFGELPDFDFGDYTFLACYIPNASGDGMEHRNSTILTSTRSLEKGGLTLNLGTVSHEFFHAWNVERIRPKSLEPFNFDEVDMSGELWFAEGFTSYYTNLILCRTGLMTPEKYITGLAGTFNYVWNSNGRKFSNPIEMSYQAPFVDAATSLDPQNRNNTFISYYSYGSVLGLALDLSLREEGLHLDDFFKKVWQEYGKPEKPYTIQNLHTALKGYAGTTFADNFFNQYIHQSKMPDYTALFKSVGVNLEQNSEKAFFGARVNGNNIVDNALIDGPAYKAGLEKRDEIIAVNDTVLTTENTFSTYLKSLKVGTTLHIRYKRFGIEKQTSLTVTKNPKYSISINNKATKEEVQNRNNWLHHH